MYSSEDDLLFKDECYQVVGTAMYVSNKLGGHQFWSDAARMETLCKYEEKTMVKNEYTPMHANRARNIRVHPRALAVTIWTLQEV